MASSNRTRPDTEELWRRYSRLSPGPKTVLWLKSLVFLSTNKSVFADCLLRGGIRAPDGRAWTVSSINLVLEALRREDLLDVDHTCPSGLLHPVAIDAVASPGGERLVAAVRRSFAPLPSALYSPRPQASDPEPLLRLARLAVYANDEAGFLTLRDMYDTVFGARRLSLALGRLLRSVALADDWLDSCAPSIQLALFEGRIAAFLAGDLSIPDLPDLITRYRVWRNRPGFAPARRALLEHDVLALRCDDARGLLTALDEADATLRQSVEATLCFLAGENAEAIGLYRAALKDIRKQAGKRKVFLKGAHGLFFLMALLRADDAALHAEIQADIDILPLDARPHPAGWIALQVFLWLAQGLEGKARAQVERLLDHRPADPVSDACLALAAHAVDPALSRKRAADHAARFAAVRDTLPLPARMYAEILAEVAPTPRPYAVFLESTASACRVAFTRLIRVSQPWERALESLDAFLFPETRKSTKDAAARRERRLVWFVDPATLAIEVAEQSARGRDG